MFTDNAGAHRQASDETVLLWDDEAPPPNGDWTIVLWRSYGLRDIPDAVSIPRLVEENADALRSRYLAWVYELGELRIKGRRLIEHLQLRPGFSYWWMTLLVEKCNFAKSPQIDDAIRLLAFTDWAAGKTIGSITLASVNQPLAECLRTWCEKSGIQFEWQRLPARSANLSWVRRVYQSLPLTLQALAWLSRHIVDRWPLRGVGLQEWQQTDGRVTFVSYLLNLVPEAAKTGRYESRYWANLPEVLQHDGYKTNWLHLYVKDALLPDTNKAADIIRAFNKTKLGVENHVTLDTFLCIRVALQALKDWGKLVWKGQSLKGLISPVASEKIDLWPLFAEDWQQSMYGFTAMSNVLYLRLFDAAMNALPKQRIGCYLQENQGWEFALLQAWKAAGHGRIVGCPHSSVRYWDLRYHFDPRLYSRDENKSIPLPDQIALNGPAATDAYLAGGYPAVNLLQVEALRYLYLNHAIARRKVDSQDLKHGLRLLVLGDYLASNTRLQMGLLAQAMQSLPADTVITVKPHPACPIYAEDYPELRLMIVMEPLTNLLAECDVAYTSAVTSAAVDVYCAGVPVISVLDATILNLSPLRGREGVYYTSTPDKLVQALKSIIATPPTVSTRQDFFTIDKELPRWRRLFVDTGLTTTNIH